MGSWVCEQVERNAERAGQIQLNLPYELLRSTTLWVQYNSIESCCNEKVLFLPCTSVKPPAEQSSTIQKDQGAVKYLTLWRGLVRLWLCRPPE